MNGIVWLLRNKWFFTYYFVFYFTATNLSGQVFIGDAKFVSPYQELTPYFPEIHTGTQYVQANRHVDGHPFYNNQLLGSGTIKIGGFNYIDTFLQYDIVNDLVITLSPLQNKKSILDPDKIEMFTLGDTSTFVKVRKDFGTFYHRNGFYREIIPGNIGLYCKHYKDIVKDSSPMSPLNKFFENQKFYIVLEDEFHPIRKRKDAFNLLQVSKREVRSEFRQNNLKFKKDKEAYLKIVVNQALKTIDKDE